MTNILQNLHTYLCATQDIVKGVVIRNQKDITLLVEENEHIVTTISIGVLGGLTTDYIPKTHNSFKIVRFPDGKSLAEMMAEPMIFTEWYDKHVTPFVTK